jgi:hypothetical protein
MCIINECCLGYKDYFELILGAILSVVVTLLIIKYFRPRLHICTPEITEIDWYEKDDETKKDKNNLINEKEKGKNNLIHQKQVIKVPIQNLRKRKAAINLRTEICVVQGKYTYHFDLDRQDFIILPKRWSNNDSSERTYIAYKLTDFTSRRTGKNFEDIIELLKNNNSYIRVRVHAGHEFTGFGKAFNAKFCLKNGSKFERVKENELC